MTRKQTAFNSYHPLVALLYFLGCMVVGMTVFQPAFILVFFLMSFLYCAIVIGFRAAVKTVLFQALLVVAIAVANPLFSASGTTEIVRVGVLVIYQESVLFGAAMGVLLMGVFISLRNAANVLSSDKVMACCKGVLPTITLMISMALRLMPLFVRRGRMVQQVHTACTAAASCAAVPSATSGSLVASTVSSTSFANRENQIASDVLAVPSAFSATTNSTNSATTNSTKK